MSELIRVRFEGGIADKGQLHFYEYSRSQYARARFLATVENFRRTGVVAERITVSSNVEIIVRTPQEGSFVEDVLVPAVQEGIAVVVSTPLSALISYVWHMIIDRPEKTENAVKEFARVRIAEIEAGVVIEQERTKQIEALTAIAEGGRATSSEALELVKYALETTNQAIGRLGYNPAEIAQMARGLEAEGQRETEFRDHRPELENIDEDTLDRLTSRLRPMVPEMALPLRRSATTMSMSGEGGVVYADLDRSTAAAIEGKETLREQSIIVVQVRSYDRIAGVGKVSSDEFQRVLNFVVPLRTRNQLLDEILAAMREDYVAMICRRTIDKSGMTTSLVLIGFIDMDDYDELVEADVH